MRLTLASTAPWTGGYSSADIREPWLPGEVRTVTAEVGRYLLDTFPTLFAEAPAPVAAAPPQAEPVATDPRPRRRG